MTASVILASAPFFKKKIAIKRAVFIVERPVCGGEWDDGRATLAWHQTVGWWVGVGGISDSFYSHVFSDVHGQNARLALSQLCHAEFMDQRAATARIAFVLRAKPGPALNLEGLSVCSCRQMVLFKPHLSLGERKKTTHKSSKSAVPGPPRRLWQGPE